MTLMINTPLSTSTSARSRAALGRVLLVDDDAMMLAVLGDMLKDRGAGIIATAQDGRAGIAALDRWPVAPGLVVCDLQMPESDGFQFMEELGKRNYAGAVFLVSGMDSRTLNSASLMARFHRLNIVATLPKPVDDAALSAAIAKLG
ncbi:hypothetical protein BH09PSE6_BH09PSE6_13630 [soil metagenome]